MIKIISSNTTDPSTNIATEEFLLKNSKESFLFIYINTPSVIIGKHQNAFAEVSAKYIIDNNIPLIRRISGGGTVVHDNGNLNFCFISNHESIETLSYKKCIEPIKDFLTHQYGISPILSERNDIQVNNRKVTGSAFHIYKKRTIAHGTLLVNSDIKEISKILKSATAMFDSNGVKSKRSRIMNLGEISNIPSNIEIFKDNMISFFTKQGYSYEDILNIVDYNIVKKLCQDKYTKWDWNIAYGPKFTFHINKPQEDASYRFHVEKGYISSAYKNDYIIINTEDKVHFKKNVLVSFLQNKGHKEIAIEIDNYLL
ncbi:lipoate--protein ligase [Halosquirtibacter xylanolyticus]|uniref:lipoate--protein ligase family protein n=1 Tax=Halosquirtibacter xylanolyticus TaxID=3374599 RepID=UPI00374A1DE3|nr:lipoate--protein ligase [Prolixibacteraceae bacterium]